MTCRKCGSQSGTKKYCRPCLDWMKKQAEAAALKKSRAAKKFCIISDEEQRQINSSVNAVLNIDLEPPKIITPGTLEFDQIVQQVTPIKQIKNNKERFRTRKFGGRTDE